EEALTAAEGAPGNREVYREVRAASAALERWCDYQARRLNGPGQWKAQAEALTRLVDVRRRLLAALLRAEPQPRGEGGRRPAGLASTRLTLARAAGRLRDHDLALGALRDLPAEPGGAPAGWEHFGSAAAVAASCVVLVGEDRRLSEEQTRRGRQRGVEV